MGKVVSSSAQRESAQELINDIDSIKGVEAEVVERANGTKTRNIVRIICKPENWRKLAKRLKKKHKIDYCSMITGIHWPEAGPEKNWELVYHFLRTGINDPPVIQGMVEPIISDPTKVQGNKIPLEIEVKIYLPETREPTIDSVQDIWIGADWNEKETWDLVGIGFAGHIGMRRVLQPHETPLGFHPLQKQHKLRYHDFEEMYDDAQGFQRKPQDTGKIK